MKFLIFPNPQDVESRMNIDIEDGPLLYSELIKDLIDLELIASANEFFNSGWTVFMDSEFISLKELKQKWSAEGNK